MPQDGSRVRAWRGGLAPQIAWDGDRQILDIVAVVSVGRDILASSKRGNGCAQIGDLTANVVEVVLARDLLPASLEDSTEQIADKCAPRIPDVQRPRRIG